MPCPQVALSEILIISQLLFLISLIALIWLIVLAFRRSALWGFAVLLLSPITATIYALKYWDESKKPFGVYASSFVAGFLTFAYIFSSWGGVAVIDAALDFDQGDGRTLNDEAAFEFAYSTLNFIENADESQAGDVAAMRDFVSAMESGNPEEAACGMYQEMLRREQTAQARATIRQNMAEMECSEARPQSKRDAEPGAEPVVGSQLAQYNAKLKSQLERVNPIRYEQVFKPIDVARAADYVGRSVVVTRNNGKQKECKLVGVDGDKLVFEQRIGSGTMTFSYNDYDITALEALVNIPI
jgi:hypothetical protein